MKVNPEYEALLPKLPPEDYEELKASIKSEGLHYPIIVNKEEVILDGHHRYRICIELGIEPRSEVKEFPNALLEKKFVIESNLRRRHLNKFQRAKLVLPLLEIEKELAKEKQGIRTDLQHEGNISLMSQSKSKRKPLTPQQKETRRLEAKLKREQQKKGGEPSKPRKQEIRARAVVAKKANLSDRTLEKAKEILEKGSEGLKQKVESGEMSINSAFKRIKQSEKKKKELEMIERLSPPEGKYQVIVVDPPWPYEYRVDDVTHRARSPYSQMTVEQIITKTPPCADDCIVWLWTTNAFMHDAFHVLEAWGLEAKTILTWKKNKFGLGDWLRGQTEHCILAIKGKPIVTLTNQSTLLEGKLREHSRKPDSFFTLVESLCHGSKYEMYGREKREGWTVSGIF